MILPFRDTGKGFWTRASTGGEGEGQREGGREEELGSRGMIDSTPFRQSDMVSHTTASDIDMHTGGCRGIDCSARNLGDGWK